MNDYVTQLIQQGQRAAQSGDNERARSYLQAAVDIEGDNAVAWLWLAGVSEPAEAIKALERVVELDPTNNRARQGLAQLQAQRLQAPPASPIEPEEAPPPRRGTSTLGGSGSLSIEQELRASLRDQGSGGTGALVPTGRVGTVPGDPAAPGPAASGGNFLTPGTTDFPYRVAVATLGMTLGLGAICVLMAMLGAGPF